MSVDIHWDTLTSGSDGEQIAETVRAFVHEKFQQVTLPRFIRSVRVHSFDFGTIAPKVEIKDICDPLPDFYNEHEDGYSSPNDDCQDAPSDEPPIPQSAPRVSNARENHRSHATNAPNDGAVQAGGNHVSHVDTRTGGPREAPQLLEQPASPLFTNLQTSGIPGGTSNLTYFHLPFGPGLSGTATPLAAVAGAHFQNGWPDTTLNTRPTPQPAASQDTLQAVPSTSDPSSRPQSQHQFKDSPVESKFGLEGLSSPGLSADELLRTRESNPNDIQVVAHVKYAGDLRLSLTAEILLDYPMPSFVGIPLQLNITGLRFDGIAILAYIKKRAHVCFLSPEDAEAFVDQPSDEDDPAVRPMSFGGLLEEIRVESEIGEKDNGKQVLKNVGKVEKFILEQVRRIFEDEFVYPSFWTFLL
jgi:distribution and morphology protein 12